MIIRLGVVGAIIGALFYFFFKPMLMIATLILSFVVMIVILFLCGIFVAWLFRPLTDEDWEKKQKERKLKKSKPKKSRGLSPKTIDQDLLNRVCFEYDLTPEDEYAKFGRTNGALRNALKEVDNQSVTN